MAARARNRKGQFTKRRRTSTRKGQVRKTARRAYTGRRNAPARSRRTSTRKGQVRKTARRAYTGVRRRARRNAPKWDKALMSIGLWAAGATLAQQWITAAAAPMLPDTIKPYAPWISIAGLGAVGAWLLKKASTRNAGYAVMGIAVAQAASVGYKMVMTQMGSESAGGFLPAADVVRPRMRSAVVPSYNPVAGIVVPG
jgi:hypothetical protein